MQRKCAFKRFKFACNYIKENFINKTNNFNNIFCKILYTKSCIISLKHFLLNKKIVNEENKIIRKKMKIFNYKNNFNFFINEINQEKRIKKIFFKYNNYIINHNYIIFFKSIAISLQRSSSRKQKNSQAKNFYLFNLIKKGFFSWKKFYQNKKAINNKKLRRKIIGKILINNLRNNLYEQRMIGMNYNNFLLKKYYFNRLRRTVHYLINNRIAELKFISKYIFLWKEISHNVRTNKFNGLFIFSEKIYPNLYCSYINKMKRMFIYKFKQKNIYLLQNEINETKIENYKSKIELKLKKNIFKEIKNNYIIGKIKKKTKFYLQEKNIWINKTK